MDMDVSSVFGAASVVIPAASAIASAVNHTIREKQAAEAPVPKWFLGFASVLNVLSVNLDKALQLFKLFKK